MTHNQNQYNKIKTTSIMTASPQELTLMLYDGAIKFGNQAIIAIDNQEIEKASNSIIRVEDIIIELQTTLNTDYDIANSLDMLYDYIYNRLVEANLTKNKEILKESVDLIRDLRNTWKEAMQIYKNVNLKQEATS